MTSYTFAPPAESTARQVFRISLAILLSLMTACYMLPAGIAIFRRHSNLAPLFLVNLLLGWTLLGWVVALAWSFTRESQTVVVVAKGS